MKSSLKKSIIAIFLFLILPSFLKAQKAINEQWQNDYKKGVELFQKQKYAAAQKFFSDFILHSDQRSLEKTNAEYYSVICAIYLYNNDSELLLEKFLKNNPESTLKTDACFEMGKYQYDKKAYKKALSYFSLIEKHDLSNEDRAEFYFKSGYSYFMSDSLDKARIAFYEIKDIDSKYSSSAIYYYSHIAYSQKNYETALQGFNRLVKDESFSSIVPYYIAQCYYYQKKNDELIAFAVPLIDSVTKSRVGEFSKLIGDAYFFKNQYKEALPYFERFVKNTPSINAEDNYEIGFSYYKIQQYKEAIKFFEQASIGQTKTAQNALYHLADCYIKTGNKKGARVAFEGASRLDFDEKIKEDALFNYALVTYEISYAPFNEGIKAFNEYISLYPTSSRSDEAYNYLTLAYLNTHNYKDALTFIEKIKIKDHTIRKAYQRIAFYRGLELFNNLRYQESIQLLNTSLTNGEYDLQLKAEAYFWIGEANYRLGNIQEALSNYNLFMNAGSAQKTNVYTLAHYNIGYVQFNQKKISEAANWFKKYVNLVKEDKTELTGDAFNRLGDCYFEKKEYQEAIDYYTKAIVNGKSHKDYAVFQKGFTLGIMGKPEQKISYLNQLSTEFPESPYIDDATYEIGNSYLVQQRNDLAVKYFNRIVTEFPTSTYVKKALLQLGLIYFNLDKNDEAMKVYKKLVADYPGSQEAKNALVGLKNIHIEKNDVDGYIEYTKNLGQFANITLSEEDSLTYIAGENLYMQGNCDKSLENFNKYIQKFPEGSFIINANFYKAECLYRQRDFTQSLEGYNLVLSKPRNNFTESALIAAGNINVENKNYQAAIDNYVKLEELAELPANIQDARIRLLRLYYESKEYNNAIAVAKRLLPSEKLSPEELRKAQYMLAKSYLATNSHILAQEEFRKLSKEVKSPEGAEAKYLMAQMLFEQQEYTKAEAEIFDFIDRSTPQQYWIARSFLLLADVYLKKNDAFQASQTLQSIIENYDNKTDGIVGTAKEKLLVIQGKAAAPFIDSNEIQIKLK